MADLQLAIVNVWLPPGAADYLAATRANVEDTVRWMLFDQLPAQRIANPGTVTINFAHHREGVSVEGITSVDIKLIKEPPVAEEMHHDLARRLADDLDTKAPGGFRHSVRVTGFTLDDHYKPPL